jgi:hypothetical protein
MCRNASKLLARRRLFILSLSIASLFVLAGAAQARTETISWSQPNMSNVTGWKIYFGSSSRNYSTIIDAGKPTPDGNGVYRFDIDVPGTDTVYVSMKSYNIDNVESVLSNERIRPVGGTPDPDPVPDPGSNVTPPYWVN